MAPEISQACGRAHAGVSATEADGSGVAQQGDPKNLEAGQSTTCARRGRQRLLQEEYTQPDTKADIISGERGGAVANGGVPPRLEGRGIHRRAGKLVLTFVAMGHSASVSEEGWCVLVGVD
jgi:hypothetical protein